MFAQARTSGSQQMVPHDTNTRSNAAGSAIARGASYTSANTNRARSARPNSPARSRAAVIAAAEKSRPTTSAPRCASASEFGADMALQMQHAQSRHGSQFRLDDRQPAPTGAQMHQIVAARSEMYGRAFVPIGAVQPPPLWLVRWARFTSCHAASISSSDISLSVFPATPACCSIA